MIGLNFARAGRLSLAAFVAGMLLATTFARSVLATEPLPLTNHKSGISVSLSGANGADWAVEMTCHDEEVADQILYVKSSVNFSLAHNANNTLEIDSAAKIPHVLGTTVPKGAPNGGEIRYKIDRDQQAHAYCGPSGSLPPFAVAYATPFNFDTLTYSDPGRTRVLGMIGDNGLPYGNSPQATKDRFCYGLRDAFGNEWHVLTYWDNDVPLCSALHVDGGRAEGSDGYCFPVCVNPLTPIVQLTAGGSAQYYTTPLKTYHIPRIWDRTTYLTAGVQISFVNLTNSAAVMYRVDGGAWQTWSGAPLLAETLFSGSNSSHVLEARCGPSGAALSRAIVFNPDYPAPTEHHGYLLWADETERQALVYKLKNVQPFKISYQNCFRSDSWVQGLPGKLTDQRGVWRFWPGLVGNALSNALVVAVEGPTTPVAPLLKQRLLWMSRLEPIGFECHIDEITPAKDYLSELGQTEELWVDAAVAYDIAAGFYRSTQDPGGLTPIEEILVRDGLAKVAKSLLQFRDNYSATYGGGDSHWPLGYELSLAAIAMAMPTYKTPYYGVSGGDCRTINNLADGNGKYWNPFPDQGATWYAAATDPWIARPGYPNNVHSFRSDYLITDDGWWAGANDMVGAPCNSGGGSDRYVTGPNGTCLVDVQYGDVANAECRVELQEMNGYENPFVERIAVLDCMRRIKGDTTQAGCVTNYLRRRMTNGAVTVTWNPKTKIYTPDAPRVETAVYTFNHYYEFASLPGPVGLVSRFLDDLKAYYGISGTIDQATHDRIYNDTRKIFYDPYGLVLCEDPATLPPHAPERNHPPIVKPLFKYVVKPGEPCVKYVLACDLDGNPLTITVNGLPKGATWDPQTRVITWMPTANDAGVHVVTVTADDGKSATTRPFAMIVKTDAGSGRIPAALTGVTAALTADHSAVVLNWTKPSGVAVAAYAIYRDGILWASAPADATSWTDSELILPSSKTRYDISLWATNGAESSATAATPDILEVPGAGNS
jgi:hypothetical protein